jgi:hypothetical protein
MGRLFLEEGFQCGSVVNDVHKVMIEGFKRLRCVDLGSEGPHKSSGHVSTVPQSTVE